MPLSFSHSYAGLPPILHRSLELEPVPAPRTIIANEALAKSLGLPADWQDTLLNFGGKQGLAMAYAGHQFGGFNAQLGDGRAALLAEIIGSGGESFDVHLKGSGATPFSRNGDGKATLSAMLREYIVSEGFAGLGIPTTRSLAVVATGEPVYRERAEQGAVLFRLAKSHVRVGTFQFLAVRQEIESLKALADYEMARNFGGAPLGADRYRWLLEQVIARQAPLIAQWMSVGFIHGVMNTDNMQLAGETIDFGPCAFMDVFHPQKVFSSIDRGGRYAWDKQPVMALWNLTRLAESMLPLLEEDRARAIAIAESELEKFLPQFEREFETRMLAKLGIFERREVDADFIASTLQHMADRGEDFTNFFLHLNPEMIDLKQPWHQSWIKRLGEQPQSLKEASALMARSNPVVIARNHRVAEALKAAEGNDLAPLHKLLEALKSPFDQELRATDLTKLPTASEEVLQTFCGT
ncbi:MAG: protein adenylyltransferase SelO family protein [Aestuariivirga sp.]